MSLSFFDPSLQWLLVWLILFCATVVQGGVGFGFGLIAAPLLALFQPQLLPGPLMVASLTLTVIMALHGWRLVEYGLFFWLLLGFLPGLWLGAVLLQVVSVRETALLFGFLVLSAVALSASGWQPRLRPGALVPAGVFSAILSITTTMGGPPVALVLQTLPGERFRYTLAFFFALTGVLTLASLGLIQRVGMIELAQGGALIPPVLLGLWISGYVGRWLDKGKTRKAVLSVAGLSGLVVILRAWFYPL